MSDFALYKCESGHICKVGTWVTEEPTCSLCKIIEVTHRTAGYIPQFSSKEWKISDTKFRTNCSRGHTYTVDISAISSCRVCKVMEKMEEENGFLPISVHDDGDAEHFLLICALGHKFMAHADCTNCYACDGLEALREKNGPGSTDTIAGGAIYWSRFAPIRFKCNKCGVDFYASRDDVKSEGSQVCRCESFHAGSSRYISDTLLFLEKYFRVHFTDGAEISANDPLRVTGYSIKARAAVFHTEHKRLKGENAAAVEWCQKYSVHLFYVSAKDREGIKKTLAYQISELDSIPVDEVLLILGA